MEVVESFGEYAGESERQYCRLINSKFETLAIQYLVEHCCEETWDFTNDFWTNTLYVLKNFIDFPFAKFRKIVED